MITTMVRLAGAIVLLALGFTPALSLAVQTESPVDCDEGVIAEPVGFAYGDHTSSGCTIDSPTDLDRFEFCGTIGDEVKLNVLSLSPMDPTVEVRDSGFGLVSQGSCNHVCSFMLNFSLPMTDCYTVFVSDVGTDEPGAYTLQLERILPVPDTAVHMDYDKSESNPISDTISPGTDVDFYTFDATAGTDIRLNVLSLNPTDPVVEIRDPSGAVVVDGVADGATCNHVCSFSVDLLPAVSGTYSLIIYDNGIDESGGYQLSLWCLAGPCDGIPDPSGPLISYVTPVSDTISPGVAGDFYTFNATAGTDIRLNVSSLNPTDPVVEIRDPNGTVVVNGVVDGASCIHVCSFSLDLPLSVSGTYSLIIYDNGIDETGGYEIGLQCLLGSCTDAAPVCSDNCIDMPNSRLIPDEGGFSQRDTDADGYGNLCDPDFDGNGVVDPFDFSQLKAVFGSASAPHEDLNGNGVVDPFDFSLLKHFFGGEPGPSSCDTGPPRP